MSREAEIFYHAKAEEIDATIEWAKGMIEILIEKESNGDIGNAMAGVIHLLNTCQSHAEAIMKKTDF